MSPLPSLLYLKIVRTRCLACGHECFCLVPPGCRTRAVDAAVVLDQLRCGITPDQSSLLKPAPCGGPLCLLSGRGLAHRLVSVGEGSRWNVDEPKPHELLGAKPGRAVVRGPRVRGTG